VLGIHLNVPVVSCLNWKLIFSVCVSLSLSLSLSLSCCLARSLAPRERESAVDADMQIAMEKLPTSSSS
jgi:hypothetical protein